ncbi:MAG: ribose 5-phosphate isomerase B [Acidobacteriota bacterium]|nr:ribose 5-phosphate isomerase B [Acidobacteriota bacterium]
MRIAIGADHAGVALKARVKDLLASRGIEFEDVGTTSTDSVDYPDFAEAVARRVGSGEFDRGILTCGSGIGMAIAANKVAGVRAAAINDETSARLSREHNDINVLALGERTGDPDTARRIVDIFLDTPFAGGRHQQRIDKISSLDHKS